MDERRLRILTLRAQGETFANIGLRLNLTKERVMQLHASALHERKQRSAGAPNTPEHFYRYERWTDRNTTPMALAQRKRTPTLLD